MIGTSPKRCVIVGGAEQRSPANISTVSAMKWLPEKTAMVSVGKGKLLLIKDR